MKKSILLMLFYLTLTLSACSQSEEDIEYTGIVVDGKSFGYEYSVIKEQNKFTWKLGYKGDTFLIEENATNQDNLLNYMNAINDSKLVFTKLIISVSFLLIVIIIGFIRYKNNRKVFKEGNVVITILIVITIYITFKESLELSNLLQDVKYYHSILTN